MECGRMYVMNELGVEVRGAHASNRAKRGAASVVVVQRWASPHPASEGSDYFEVEGPAKRSNLHAHLNSLGRNSVKLCVNVAVKREFILPSVDTDNEIVVFSGCEMSIRSCKRSLYYRGPKHANPRIEAHEEASAYQHAAH